jgi:hypothetical protein
MPTRLYAQAANKLTESIVGNDEEGMPPLYGKAKETEDNAPASKKKFDGFGSESAVSFLFLITSLHLAASFLSFLPSLYCPSFPLYSASLPAVSSLIYPPTFPHPLPSPFLPSFAPTTASPTSSFDPGIPVNILPTFLSHLTSCPSFHPRVFSDTRPTYN